jgi:hypothetical protein
LSSDIVPNQQEILATPTPKKKRKEKKKKPTRVLPLFHEATHSPVSPEYKSQNISTNLSNTQLTGKELIYRYLLKMYPDPWNKDRLMMVKNAASKKCGIPFYNVFLDGDESRWGEGNSVFH